MRGRGSAGRTGRGTSCARVPARRAASGCAIQSPPRSSRTPSERNRCSAISFSAAGQRIVAVSGYQRSARSQTRWPPRRPTTATSPRAARISSISPILRAPHQSWSSRRIVLVILDLPREQRAARLELAQDMEAEAAVLPDEPVVGVLPAAVVHAAAHPRPEQRQVLDRVDERTPFDERALLPDQLVQLAGVVGAEPAPGNEVLRRRDGRDRVDLQEPSRRTVSSSRSRCRRAVARARRSGALLRGSRPWTSRTSF